MKKYTVYEIEKLTDGKLSKYKLTKAIETGQLNAEKVGGTKKGRGIPKYFVYEDQLNKYLKEIGESRKKKIKIPGEEEKDISSNDFKQLLTYLIEKKENQYDSHNSEITKLKERIEFLEIQNKTQPKNVIQDKQLPKPVQEKQALIQKLASIDPLNADQQKEIIDQLRKFE